MLTVMIKACLHYSKDLLFLNFVFSIFVALTGWAAGLDPVRTFCLFLVTGGMFLSSYFYGRQRGHQYYFFYNLGISRTVLYVSAFGVDVLLAALLMMLKNNLR